jgi:hypothetical protein
MRRGSQVYREGYPCISTCQYIGKLMRHNIFFFHTTISWVLNGNGGNCLLGHGKHLFRKIERKAGKLLTLTLAFSSVCKLFTVWSKDSKRIKGACSFDSKPVSYFLERKWSFYVECRMPCLISYRSLYLIKKRLSPHLESMRLLGVHFSITFEPVS